jgi:hypothetical protein
MPPKKEEPAAKPQFPAPGEDFGSTESVVRAVHALTTVIAAENGKKKVWVERNPTMFVTAMMAIFAVLSFAGQGYFQKQVGQYIDPVIERTDERMRQVEAKAAVDRHENDDVHMLLRQNDADLAVYMLEGDRYDRHLLERVAKKLRVKPEDRPEALDEAEDRVRTVRDSARVGSAKE